MKTLIKNCNLISIDNSRPKLERNIDILIEENKIKKIEKNISEENIDKVIDATNQYVLPGFINTHAHIGMSIFRETVDGLKLQDWLSKKIWPIEDNLTEQDIYYSSLYSCIEMIKTGTTTVNDHYFFPESVISAISKSGMRGEVTRVLMDINNDLDGRVDELINTIEKHKNANDNITINVGVHGLYTASKDCLIKAIQIAKKYNLNLHIHFCENTSEVEEIKQRYNVNTPSEVIEKYLSDLNVILAHCVKLSDSDFDILKNLKNINVSHCPISNLKLGCGIANLPKMLKNNINISLGTDGQGSGCNLDMFDTMKFVGLLQKGINYPALTGNFRLSGGKIVGGNDIFDIPDGQIGFDIHFRQSFDGYIVGINFGLIIVISRKKTAQNQTGGHNQRRGKPVAAAANFVFFFHRTPLL